MDVFFLTLSQMLKMFTFIMVGYVLKKGKILPQSSELALSRLETFFFVPALCIYSWMENCTPKTLRENSVLILYGLVIIIFAIGLAYLLCGIFVRKADTEEAEYERNIYKYALTFGNYGYMGYFIVLGVWGNEMFFKYSMFTLCIGLACTSWGMAILIPKKYGNSSLESVVKRVFTPPVIGITIGMVAGLLNVKEFVPDFLMSVLSDASDCMGPVAMVLAGFVIGGYDIKELFSNKKVYAASAMRLILIPAGLMVLLKILGISDEIMALVLIAYATPPGLNIIVYPAAYGGETHTGASMTMIASMLSIITIPIMYLIFVVLL